MRNNHIGGIALLALTVMVLPACSKKNSSSPSATAQPGKQLYHCAMHPQIVSDKPGQCPICHMDLVPLETMASETASMIPGQADVQLSSSAGQRIGVTQAAVEERDLVRDIRAAARVAYDPGLYNASLEHQEALRFLEKARQQQNEENIEEAKSTVRSSELHLRQMGLSDSEIEAIARPGFDPSTLLVGSRSGTVWIYADVHDDEIGMVHPGQSVELTSPAFTGEIFPGTVKALDRVVNPDTRTLRIRIQSHDAGGRLRPETYLSALIHVSLGRKLSIPVSAVIDTGTRQLVYVVQGTGHYEPREVALGQQTGDYYEVLSGLKAGEQVVTAANFFIDSESKIQAATQSH